MNEKDLREKIRFPIIFYCIYIALCLYQTERLGTLLASVFLLTTIVTFIYSETKKNRGFSIQFESVILFLFLVYASVNMLINSGLESSYYRFAGLIVLFLVLINIQPNKKEIKYVENIFLISTLIYAIDALAYCITNTATRFYHGKIEIFGTFFDPNFIGINFVAASAFFLDRILHNQKLIINISCLAIMFLCIVYTASRGSFLAFLISSSFLIILYYKDKTVIIRKKILITFLCTILLYYIISYVSASYDIGWSRISSISMYDDNGRFLLWNQSIELFKMNPIFGNGYRIMYNTYQRASHNTYLQILVEDGILGFILMLIFLIKMTIIAYKNNRVLFVALIAMFVQIFFLDALDNRGVWILLSWTALLYRKNSNCIDSFEEYKMIE